MSNESIGIIDQEGSMAQLLASVEKELSAFVTAVNHLFDAARGLKAGIHQSTLNINYKRKE